jgi:hypothetical protein
LAKYIVSIEIVVKFFDFANFSVFFLIFPLTKPGIFL